MFNTSSAFSRTTPVVLSSGIVDFSATPLSGDFPLTVQFTDLSTVPNITNWEWDFNNDGVIDSTEQNPSWTYQDMGTYSVKLKIYFLSVNSNLSITKIDYITVTGVVIVPGPSARILQLSPSSNGVQYYSPNPFQNNDGKRYDTRIAITAITTDLNDNIYIASNYNTHDNAPGQPFIAKYNSNLQSIWMIDLWDPQWWKISLDLAYPWNEGVIRNITYDSVTDLIYVIQTENYYLNSYIPEEFSILYKFNTDGTLVDQIKINVVQETPNVDDYTVIHDHGLQFFIAYNGDMYLTRPISDYPSKYSINKVDIYGNEVDQFVFSWQNINTYYYFNTSLILGKDNNFYTIYLEDNPPTLRKIGLNFQLIDTVNLTGLPQLNFDTMIGSARIDHGTLTVINDAGTFKNAHNLYIAMTAQPYAFPYTDPFSIYVKKLDINLQSSWLKQFQVNGVGVYSTQYSHLSGVEQDIQLIVDKTDESVYILVGHQNLSLNGPPYHNIYNSTYMISLIKLDANGNKLWERTLKTNKAEDRLDPFEVPPGIDMIDERATYFYWPRGEVAQATWEKMVLTQDDVVFTVAYRDGRYTANNYYDKDLLSTSIIVRFPKDGSLIGFYANGDFADEFTYFETNYFQLVI